MLNLLSPPSRIAETALQFASALKVKISYTTLQQEIEEHPFYPSLLSISEVLSSFGIKNVTARFSPTKILDIPPPFLVQLKGKNDGNQFFSVIKKITDQKVYHYDSRTGKWGYDNKTSFVNQFTGVVLMAEAGEAAGEKKYDLQVQLERRTGYLQIFSIFILPLMFVAQSVLGFINHGSAALLPFITGTLLLAGSAIATLLVWHDIDRYSPAVQAVCGISKKLNCNAVLDSKGAGLFGIKWSTIGFSYFVGGLLYIMVKGFDHATALSTLWQINLLGTLYVFYSLYYQWKIAKNWCVLCLLVQVVLIGVSLTGFLGGLGNAFVFAPAEILKLATLWIIPFISAMGLSAVLLKTKEFREGKLAFQRLKRNPENVKKELNHQPRVLTDPEGLGIVVGDPNAANKIIKVCNPYCNPCSLVHDTLKDLLNTSSNLSVRIIFTSGVSTDDKRYYPVRHFLALYESGKFNIDDVLSDWHHSPDKNYEAFAARYPLGEDTLIRQNAKIAAMQAWCAKMDIAFTPTFFINGFQLPATYGIGDLKYCFLD